MPSHKEPASRQLAISAAKQGPDISQAPWVEGGFPLRLDLADAAHNPVATWGESPLYGDGPGLSPAIKGRYLERLGLAETTGAPTLERLNELTKAHLTNVAYSTLDLHRRFHYRAANRNFEPRSISPVASASTVTATGAAGFCIHANGAFGALLRSEGFDVTFRPGWVEGSPSSWVPWNGPNHLAITVDGLPTNENPTGTWWVDVGLPDGPMQAMPVVHGQHEQGRFSYAIERSDWASWRFVHDAAGSFRGIHVADRPAEVKEFEASNRWLSADRTSHSLFTKLVIIDRRDDHGNVTEMVGHRLTLEDGQGNALREPIVFDDQDAWFGAISTELGVDTTHMSALEKSALWSEVNEMDRSATIDEVAPRLDTPGCSLSGLI